MRAVRSALQRDALPEVCSLDLNLVTPYYLTMATTVYVKVGLPKELAEKIAKRATQDRRSLSAYLAILVEKAIAR